MRLAAFRERRDNGRGIGTLGEIRDAWRAVFGSYEETARF